MNREKGFTLLELLIALFMSSIIYTAIIIIFVENKSQMTHSLERSETVSALNHAMKEVGKVIRSGVSDPWTVAGTYPAANLSTPTYHFLVDTYDPVRNFTAPYLVERHIDFNMVNGTLGLKMSGTSGRRKLSENITLFKIFDDSITPRAGFTDIPPALPLAIRTLPDGTSVNVSGYTILIQAKIKILNKTSQSNLSVDGTVSAAGTQSVWRYLQVYPQNPYIF